MAGTWERIEHWGEDHPVALGVGIFVTGAVIIYVLIPKRSAQPQQTGPSDAYYNAIASMAASGNSLQAAQLAAQQHTADTQAQLQAVQTQVAGDVSIATIQGQTATATAQIQADAASVHDRTIQESTDLASTLSAQVQQAGIATTQAIAGINAAAATTQAQIAANASTTNTAIAAGQAEAGYQAQLYGHLADLYPTLQQQSYAAGGGGNVWMTLPGVGQVQFLSGPGVPTPNQLLAAGYTPEQANRYLATQIPGLAA